MWTDINKKQPTHHGAYNVFGTVNKGTEYETNCMFTAYWCEQSKSFTDRDGEDLTGINEGVKFWFDFSKVADPIPRPAMVDFFSINLPYVFARNEENEWMCFNREYMPIGFNHHDYKGYPRDYDKFPLHYKYKNNLTEELLISLADDESCITRNENGEINSVFLYDDSTNPIYSKEGDDYFWDRYFKKIKILSKLNSYK